MRILITEDNVELAGFIKEALNREGFLSDHAPTAADLKVMLDNNQYAALVLDLGLPDVDGLQIVKSLRSKGVMVPVLILTARGGIHDRITGLNSGADDYLTKPFAVDELIARLRALLRRPSVMSSKTIEQENICLDVINKTVTINGVNVLFGRTELSVLEYLLRNTGLTVSKEALESGIYQEGYEITENALQVAIHRVRKKLKDNGAYCSIKSIRGVGYIFK